MTGLPAAALSIEQRALRDWLRARRTLVPNGLRPI
jgi:hypothetical protein